MDDGVLGWNQHTESRLPLSLAGVSRHTTHRQHRPLPLSPPTPPTHTAGESALQRSGLNYTVVRPGGLLDKPRRRSGSTAAAAGPDRVVLAGPDSFGLPPRRRPGSVLRSQVAECCVAALVEPAARGKVVEMIAEEAAPHLGYTELFSSVA